MNKHSQNIFDLHLSSAESLEIAAEIIGFVHSRAESILTVHMEKFRETNVSNLSPDDYLLLTELITVTEIALKTVLCSCGVWSFSVALNILQSRGNIFHIRQGQPQGFLKNRYFCPLGEAIGSIHGPGLMAPRPKGPGQLTVGQSKPWPSALHPI